MGVAEPRRVEGARVGAALTTALYRHAPFVAVVAVYVVAGVLFLRSLGRATPFTLAEAYQWPLTLTVLYLLVTFIGIVVRDVFIGRRRPSSATTWRYVAGRWLTAERMMGTAIVLVALPALLGVMYNLRLSLTLVSPFRWDTTFVELEALVHFGRQPWEWLQPVFGHPAITRVIDAVYVYGWFAALWLGVIWQTIHGREPVRSQFLLAFAVSWILLGTFAAMYFSSAGPAFYAQATGLEGPFSGLLDYLHSVHSHAPLFAVANQERLATSYTEWGGMTAMPSMHLTIVTVVVLAAVRTHRWLGWIFVPFLAMILLGSVLLGWHYAIDGYAGILGALIIWASAGIFVRWWQGRRANPSLVAAP